MSDMADWFEHLIRDIVWKAISDAFGGLAAKAEAEINSKLASLNGGQLLSSSPVLVRVLATNASSINLLVRGRIPIPSIGSTFMRIELVIDKVVHLVSGGPTIKIDTWITVIGDLQVKKESVFEAALALGYDRGVWIGRGMIKVLPAGFGLDVFLGGFSDRGMMIGLDVDFPVPIPLGSTGLGLGGIGGDFAYNFIARLEKDGLPIPHPTAEDYVRWARDHNPDRWAVGPIDETAVGVGIRCDLVTLADFGRVLKLDPLGVAVLTPGPVFILGGKGEILSTDSAEAEGYLAVDIRSASLALGLGVHFKIPKSGVLLDASGSLDAFFSFADPSLWYLNLGTDGAPIQAKVLDGFWMASTFVMINNRRIAYGAAISVGPKYEWAIFTLIARIGAAVTALVGWNPVELAGQFRIFGQLGIKVWKFGFILTAAADALGHTPKPTKLEFKVSFTLSLPWPLPDVSGDKTITLGNDVAVGPPFAPPLLVGKSTSALSATGPLKLGAIHTITGRQWQLDKSEAWPDLEIVVPFNRRVIDHTNTLIAPAIGGEVQGGYEVKHHLTKVELFDLIHNKAVPNPKGVWAAGPGGDTARLHLLGQDPYAWLTPHTDTAYSASETAPRVVDQLFGFGPDEVFAGERRFHEVLVTPYKEATLITAFRPQLPTRVMRCAHSFLLRFRTSEGAAISVDQVTIFLVVPVEILGGAYIRPIGDVASVTASTGSAITFTDVLVIYGGLRLVAATVLLTEPIDQIQLTTSGDYPLLVYAVRYREARTSTASWSEKTILVPGQYRLTIEGNSTAGSQHGLPDSEPIAWSVEQSFGVKYPETLRPYLHHTSFGDSRIFLPEPHPWNPTMYGVGFPAYMSYLGVVRFVVPYMSQIFPKIRLRLAYEDGPVVEQLLAPASNPDGQRYLLQKSQDWIAAHSGSTPPDQELVFTESLTQHGMAKVTLSFDLPGTGEVKLDEWSCYVSRFTSLAQHLYWVGHCLQTSYNSAGKNVRTACAPTKYGVSLTTTGAVSVYGVALAGSHIDAHLAHPPLTTEPLRTLARGPLLATSYPIDDILPYPDELTAPPLDWRLPPTLTDNLGPLSKETGIRFARFAQETAVRFNDGSSGADALQGIQDTISHTTIEAVVDDQGRPYALWLRSPEPVDWRRIGASLRVWHVEQTGRCPNGYAHRWPLDLDVTILPSPDASSAFLVGSLAGVFTRLPRGEFTLSLEFDPSFADLPALRPGPVVAAPEFLSLTFIQPFGLDWPRPSSIIQIPNWLVDIITQLFPIPPETWQEIYAGMLTTDVVMKILRGAGSMQGSASAAKASTIVRPPTASVATEGVPREDGMSMAAGNGSVVKIDDRGQREGEA